MALPVLAATLTTIVVFFPVTLLYGVSKFLFSALALAVVISLAASYVVAMTVVPLVLRALSSAHMRSHAAGQRFNAGFNAASNGLAEWSTTAGAAGPSPRPALPLAGVRLWLCLASLLLFPLLGLSFFPRTDAGQFVINVKAPSGTRLAETEKEIAKLEDLVSHTGDSGRSWT